MFGHGFDLLFGEFETVFALFRSERVFRCGKCGVGYSLFAQCSMLLRELLCSLAHRIRCSLSLRRFPPCNLFLAIDEIRFVVSTSLFGRVIR